MNFKSKVLLIFLVLCFIFATHKAKESTSFFGKDKGDPKDVCDGNKCDGDAKSNVVDTVTDNRPNQDKSQTQIDANADDEIHVIITFTNAANNIAFHDKFRLTVSSLLQHASVPLAIHIIGDPESQELAEKIVRESTKNMKRRYRVSKTTDYLTTPHI